MGRGRWGLGVVVASILVAAPLRAQTVRGVVVEDSTQRPIDQASVTLLGSNGEVIPPGTRSATNGAFTLHAPRFGKYRVRAIRIGYQPVTSEPLDLQSGELVTVRLVMTVATAKLAAVAITERRMYSLKELSSTVGFDLRRTRPEGTFFTAEDLPRLGSIADLARTAQVAGLTLHDSLGAESLRIRVMGVVCNPTIYLDGLRIFSPVGGESPEMRDDRAASALMQINSVGVDNLYGVEIYRGLQTPPVSVSGMLGDAANRCGFLAVWTKTQMVRDSIAGVRGVRTTARTGIQVIRGFVVDLDRESGVGAAQVRLLNESGGSLGDAVPADSGGHFVIRTTRTGKLRLEAGGASYRFTRTPAFTLGAEELLIVTVFVSATRPISAPLGISVRARPDEYGPGDLGGFSYRWDRGLGGVFFGPADIRASRAATLAELLGGVEGMVVTGRPPADTIAMRSILPGAPPQCLPLYYENGIRVKGVAIDSAIHALRLDRVIGIEVYHSPAEVPDVFTDADGECGMIGVWTRGDRGFRP